MRKVFTFMSFTIYLFFYGCSNPASPEESITELIFVACEGNFGASNGSIYTLKSSGDVEFI